MKKINFKQSVLRARWLLTIPLLLTFGVGQMWAAYYITGTNGNLSGWGTWKSMTESSDGMFWYFQAASGNINCKINTKQDYDNPTALGAGARSSGFCDTDLGGNTWDEGGNINYWYNSCSYYILVYVPNTTVNSSSSAKVCASTFLPDAGYETTNNKMKYYKNSDANDTYTGNLDRANGTTTALGSVTTLYLKGFESKMWRHGSGNIYGADAQHYYFKVHRTAVAAGSTGFTDARNATSYSAGSWSWGSWSSNYSYPTYSVSCNQNLLSGLGSGNYTMSYYFVQNGSKDFRLPSDGSKFNKLTWTIDVPAVSGGNVTSDGTGTGASGTPFSVADGEEITFTAGGSQASTDANSVLYVKWGDDSYGPASTTTKTITPTTTKQSMTVKLKYYNSADELSGAETTLTIYYQSTLTPSIGISSISPSPANSGDEVTISASRQNAGTANITYQYSTNGSTWTNIGSATSSTSKTWTVPASTSTTTYYFRAQMTYEAITYTSATTTLKTYGKKTIKVKNTNGWASMLMHRWGGDKTGTSWPGESAQISAYGSGQWKQIVLYSSNTSFALVDGSNNDNHTADLTYASSVSDGNCYQIQSGTGGSLTLTSASCPEKPSVTTAAATSVATTSVTFNASSVSANNDAITAYGFAWGTTDACSSGTVTASNLGGGTSFSASKSSLTNGTTYYFKAYATNGQGTTYGDPVSVRTKFITTVTLNKQGGSDGTSEVTATEGSAMPSGKTAPGKTGYTFGGYYASAGGSGKQYYTSSMSSANNWDVAASTATIHAKWTPITYTIHFNGNGNTSGSMSDQTGVTYDAATTITANAFAKTGYNFGGWATNQERANAGTVDRADGAAHGNLTSTQGATAQLWAVWTAKTTTISYSQSGTGYGSGGQSTPQTATYDAAMPTPITTPTAANGYAFMGYYDVLSPLGTQYYNADGTSANTWDKEDAAVTLYAYFKKAEITALTLDAAQVAPGETIGVTPTVSPNPTGTTTICWEVRYADSDNPLSPQPAMTWDDGKLTFAASETSGLYKIVATLKTGNDCAAGTTLSTTSVNVQVAGSHTVTVAYKYSSTTIKASTSVTARPLVWSDEITAPDIFGYTFINWTAVDGVTIKDSENEDVTSSTEATIKIKATYNGTLTANYTPKNIVYFKDNLGWTDSEDADAHIYVNLLTADYWNDANGSGNNGVTNRNLQMDRVPGTTDIFYYDYGNKTTSNFISFTKESMATYENFHQAAPDYAHVVFPSRTLDALGTNNATGLGFYAATPMFVPLATQTPVKKNSDRAAYYNDGYWTKYLPGTGYTLQIYNAAGNSLEKEIAFTSADELMPMKVVTDLEGGHTYKFQLKRDGDVYYGNNGTMTYADHGQNTAWDFYNNSPFNMCTIVTNAAGDYTFNLSYSPNNGGTHNRLRISVDYPVASGDYRLVYTDDVHTNIHPSAIVNKVNNGTDIVSFFVREDETPVVRIQQATVDPSTGAITWNEYPTTGTPINQITGAIASAITKDAVYNFYLSMNGSGELSVDSAKLYTGNYYIRTDAANSKWDNYRTDPDHLMTYSDYLKSDVGYTHYYTHWVNKDDVGRKNVKFVIANDYSPCISDTLARETATGMWAHIGDWMEEGGDLKRSANVRFMWDEETNAISRAYVDGAQEDGSEFLLLLSSDSKIKQGETVKTQITFSDNGNWIYEANVKAQTEAQYKLKSTWGDTGNAIVQYFKGSSSETETLIGGSGDDWYDIRLIYDFKTNRLVASYVPATGTIDTEIPINADVMFIREHQGDIAQLTFGVSGAISEIKTAYGVLRLNKWTLNNKDKSTHNPLAQELTRYERDLFYISFPFRVNLEEVFGFGTYGTHWIIEEYDGAGRAANGFWADTPTFWRFITNRKGKFLEPNTGYIVAVDLDELGETSSVWANTDQVELYFPSYGSMPDIKSSSVTYEVPAHTCTINRGTEQGDRRIKDSHWNVISVPTYINTSNVTFANTDWITAGDGKLGPSFLYTVNWIDNSLTPTTGAGYTYKAMHAYIVQYKDNITWTTSVSPALAPRRNPDAQEDVEFCIELQKEGEKADQTFVRLTNDENVTSGFEFNYDLSKEFNKNKANIYTMVSTMIDDDLSITETAGNCLPMTEQTTIVPMGVQIAKAGEYTISIPNGTNGVGVTLIDNETGLRTNLALEDYRVELDAATYNNRFIIEISPIVSVLTGVEQTAVSGQPSDVRKVIIDQKMYIIKDGKVYDAQGARVK